MANEGWQTLQDLTGRKFGRLTVIAVAERGSPSGVAWTCRCDCGNEKTARGYHLKRGSVRSCGCLATEVNGKAALKHGLSTTPTYFSWRAMIQRCEDPRTPAFKYYGGRGIRVCAEWHDFPSFLRDMGHRPPGTTLDRINGSGHYEPGNCRWATWDVQCANRRKRPRKWRS